MASMGKAIQQRGRHFGVTKHAGPFAEAQIGCDDDAGALIKFAEKVEQHGTTGGAERQISQLVQYQEVGFHQHLCDLPSLALGLFLLQRIDQFDGREEAHAFAMMLNGLDADGGRDM